MSEKSKCQILFDKFGYIFDYVLVFTRFNVHIRKITPIFQIATLLLRTSYLNDFLHKPILDP